VTTFVDTNVLLYAHDASEAALLATPGTSHGGS